jgi:hypothetical protein
VIVPCSGGKDGSFVAHQLKYKYGMNPLTVTWAPLVATEIGRRNLKDSNLKFGADHYLGGYEQRMFDGQINKLRCDNPSQYGECTDWLTKSEKLLSAIGMKFYERENCEVLLR